MTRKDIIRMANASGLSLYGMGKDREQFIDYLECFADLVASAEREACAKACEDVYTGEESSCDWPTPEMCASAIRARGQA